MANVLVEEQTLTDIADAIREYSGICDKENKYKPADMPDGIKEVSNEGFILGESHGWTDGYENGFDDGYYDGWKDGKAAGGGGDEQFASLIEGTLVDAVVPEGVTKIKPYLFYESDYVKDPPYLETVTFPSTLKEIGESAFYYCEHLQTPTLNEGLEVIGNYAFCYCNAFTGEFVFPSTVRKIGGDLFSDYDALNTIHTFRFKGIPTQIDMWALNSCESAETIKVPWSEDHPLSENAPWGAPNATVIYNCLRDLIIPEGVTEIEAYEFAGDLTIKTVIFPSTLKSIGDCAFDGCENIQTITLQEGLERIGESAFSYCNNLQTPVLPEGLEVIEDYAFEGCDSFEGELVLPSTVRYIGDLFGYSGMELDAIVLKGIPDGISQLAFSGAASIGELKVPWGKGEVAGAPWGAYDATIYYNWTEEE